MSKFKPNRPIQDHEYVCSTWFERDRMHIRLETPKGRTIFELWDHEVTEAVNTGFLKVPKHPRPSDKDWQPSAVEYARNQGFIN